MPIPPPDYVKKPANLQPPTWSRYPVNLRHLAGAAPNQNPPAASKPPHAPPDPAAKPNSPPSEHPPASRLPAPTSATDFAPASKIDARSLGKEQGVTPDASNASFVNLAPGSVPSPGDKNGDVKTSPVADDDSDLRIRGVTARVTESEYQQLKVAAKRKHQRMGALLRRAYFDGAEVKVPEPNYQKWEELARALANLNQIAQHLNAGNVPKDFRPLLAELKDQVHHLRAALVGQKGSK